MSKTTSMLPSKVRGFARDFSIDQLPSGFVWNMVDYIPDRHQAKLGGRGAWTYLTSSALAGTIWGGCHAAFSKGTKLLVCGGSNLYDQTGWAAPDMFSLSPASIVGTLFASGQHNGVMLRDRVYFADATGIQTPKYVTFNGTSIGLSQLSGANAPKATVLAAYKDRLLAGGDPSNPTRLYFSPLEVDGGPPGAWDNLSYIDTPRSIAAIMPMAASILVFHDGFTSKVRGGVPPGTNIDSDMSVDIYSAQLGCVDPASIVAWQENVIFANMHGIHITDGSTIRSLTDQGGISEAWRELYALKRGGTQVSAEVYLDHLYVSILTSYTGATPVEQRSFLFICDLSERTWHRFENVEATAMIRATVGAEQVWWGVDAQNRAAPYGNRLARLSPMLAAQREADTDNPVIPYPDIVDGDAAPVLPRMETGWMRMSKTEVEKRIRALYVSHYTQSQSQPTADALNISAKIAPAPYTAFQDLGNLPCSSRYVRRRVRLGRPAYGLQVKIEQTIPSHVSALYDIGVEAWAADGTKL
jgi:hypothetical protein